MPCSARCLIAGALKGWEGSLVSYPTTAIAEPPLNSSRAAFIRTRVLPSLCKGRWQPKKGFCKAFRINDLWKKEQPTFRSSRFELEKSG